MKKPSKSSIIEFIIEVSLTITLTTLKIKGVIVLGWLWVLAPLWIPYLITVGIILTIAILDERDRRRSMSRIKGLFTQEEFDEMEKRFDKRKAEKTSNEST